MSDSGDFTMRAPRLSDLDALHELINTIYTHDGRTYAMSRLEVAELWESPDDKPALDMRVVEQPLDDTLIAWGGVTHSPAGERLERAHLDGGVHPHHRRRGIGKELMAWLDTRANDRLSSTPAHLEAVVLADRFEQEADRGALYHRCGYEDSRYFDELRRSLTDLPPIREIDGIEIRRWSPHHDELTCHLYNEAFADHWGSTPRSVAAWCEGVLTEGSFRRDLSFVAVDPEVAEYDGLVAYALNAHYEDDVTVTGRLDGWVDSLGTLRSHRKRGIAAALITHSLHAFLEAGFDSSMLGVDTENPSGAYGIYERLGYRPDQRGTTAMRVFRPAAT